MKNNHPFHNYVFFNIDKTLRDVSSEDLKSYKKEFIKKIESNRTVVTYSYTTLGFKANSVMMFWFHSNSPEKIQQLLNDLVHTFLGRHLTITHTLFGMTRESLYNPKSVGNNKSLDTLPRLPYMIVYPFTKTKEWYLLDLEKRKEMMHEHMRIGFKFSYIRQLLLYAYGIDDHEFILSYETDTLKDFQALVIALRSSRARLYTLNDLPIYTCIYQPLDRVFDVV